MTDLTDSQSMLKCAVAVLTKNKNLAFNRFGTQRATLKNCCLDSSYPDAVNTIPQFKVE